MINYSLQRATIQLLPVWRLLIFMGKFILPHKPVGYRTVNYKIINNTFRNNVVYVMMIGDKFYIGIAKDVVHRINGHKSIENAALSKYLYGRKDSLGKVNAKIVAHLAENVLIDTVYVDILEVCDSISDAVISEKHWVYAFYHLGFHDLLLNADVFNNHPNTYLDKYGLGDLMNTDL